MKIIFCTLGKILLTSSLVWSMDRNDNQQGTIPTRQNRALTIDDTTQEFVNQRVTVVDHLKAMGIDKLQQKGFTGAGIKVGVVAFAYDYSDPTSDHAYDGTVQQFINNDPNYTFRIDGHENRVVNLIAGKNEGIAPNTTVYVASYMNDKEFPQTGQLHERRALAFRKLSDSGCDVIVLSFGLSINGGRNELVDHKLREEILNFTRKGGVVFNSAGKRAFA